jgi:8-oxo-dGTP pyrophosphatase MutT (NUDIX family)
MPAVPRRARPRGGRWRTVEETSAGGLVVDLAASPPAVAVIARVNRAGRLEWCLPKGHLEGAETPEQAAVREIEEETGIRGRVVGELGTIGATPAVVAAVMDALDRAGHGDAAEALQMPLTSEKVWRVLHGR